MTYQAIIFDAEGVVIDTEGVWDEVQDAFLSRRGLRYRRDVTKAHLTGRSLLDGTAVLKEQYGLVGDLDSLAEERAELMRARLPYAVRFLPGFEPFFAEARRRFRVCLATSMPSDLLAIADRALGLRSLFDDKVVTVDDVGGVGKPAPDVFLRAAAVVGCPATACVVIEDSPLGVTAAHAAGMACVGMASTYPPEMLEAADVVVAGYDEIDLDGLDSFVATS